MRRQIMREVTDIKDVNSQGWAESFQPLTSLNPHLWPVHNLCETGLSGGSAVGEGRGSGGLS